MQPRPTIKMTYVTGLVLQAIHHGYRYGFEIMDTSGLADGTVYPALRRLEAAGLLESDWEDALAAREEGRPPRRYYTLTALGERELGRARERFRGLAGTVPEVVETVP
jgi:DNA-binding PadR family transcriptional regulator